MGRSERISFKSLGEIKGPLETSTAKQDVHASQVTLTAEVEEMRSIDIINVLLNFEIKEVCNFHLFL